MTIKHNIEISGSPEKLFDLSQDYEKRLEWDPFPESYKFLNGNQVKEGLLLRVTDKAGRKMDVEYISFKRPTVAAVKMIDGPWYIKDFAGSWSFRQAEEGKTETIFSYNIRAYPSILNFIVQRVFSIKIKQRLNSLKNYAEKAI